MIPLINNQVEICGNDYFALAEIKPKKQREMNKR